MCEIPALPFRLVFDFRLFALVRIYYGGFSIILKDVAERYLTI